jgi:alpha-L-fucosidase 2
MGRVHLTLADNPEIKAKPINERIAALKDGGKDINLEGLVFQFGRYALVSSSRAGGQTANLQGIWDQDLLPPWGSKYTININIQMNYWPAEVTNLAECAQPLFDMVQDLSETGHKTAKVYYGIDKGWVTHHNTDLWRGAAPVDASRFGMWPVGGAWLTLHICEHYNYNHDIEFLKKYYPVVKGSAEFLLNLLVEHPRLGYLVTPFSMSPEHGFQYTDGNVKKTGYVSPAPTMDVGIMRDLFPYAIQFSEMLGVDADCTGMDATIRSTLHSDILPVLPNLYCKAMPEKSYFFRVWPKRGRLAPLQVFVREAVMKSASTGKRENWFLPK